MKMNDVLYCLRCESYVKIEVGSHGFLHCYETRHYADEPMELTWCEGPFTTCAPEIEHHWNEQEFLEANIPDADELALMDANAESVM